MKMSRVWAMPNKNTFDIKPIAELIQRYNHPNSIDPFANKNRIASVTNDIDPAYATDHCLDAIDFLKLFDKSSVDLVLYDPPYSQRQVSEVYTRLGMTVDMETTQTSYWTKQKTEVSRVTKTGGIVISCGWNSGGIGVNNGFEILEILLVAHGSRHNDTIVAVERKYRDEIF